MLKRLRIRLVTFFVLLGFVAGAGVGHAVEFPAEDLCTVVSVSHDVVASAPSSCGDTVSHDSCLSHASCSFYVEPVLLNGWFETVLINNVAWPPTAFSGLSLPPEIPPPITLL